MLADLVRRFDQALDERLAGHRAGIIRSPNGYHCFVESHDGIRWMSMGREAVVTHRGQVIAGGIDLRPAPPALIEKAIGYLQDTDWRLSNMSPITGDV